MRYCRVNFMLVLTSTVHDPNGGLLPLSQEVLPRILSLFDTVTLFCTPGTSKKMAQTVKAAGARVQIRKDNNISGIYREAIRAGVRQKAAYVFYCDFDRILHWMRFYP